ncbi:serine protease [Streptomyces sp. NPDC057702]|uniref:serine protease n=1 Tax=unclassified Streptomyces TaxID=2593676 RepID=UPI00368F5552
MTLSPSPRMPRRTALRSLVVATAIVAGTLPAYAAASDTPRTADARTYTLTIHHLGRDGHASPHYRTRVAGFPTKEADQVLSEEDGASGTTTVRLPQGRYLLSSMLNSDDYREGTDWVVQPRLDLDRDTTITFDARTTKPVDVRPPDSSASHVSGTMFVAVRHAGVTRDANVIVATPTLRVAHRGPAAEPGTVKRWYDAYWNGAKHRYALGDVSTGDRALTGLVRHPAVGDLAELRVRAAARPGTAGIAPLSLGPSGEAAGSYLGSMKTPGTVSFLVTPQRGPYDIGYTNPRTEEEGPSSWYEARKVVGRVGHPVTHTFDNAVFGPVLSDGSGVTRTGDRLTVDVPLLADGQGHLPFAQPYATAATTLYRNGARVRTVTGEPGKATFDVPAGRANYRLTSTVRRAGGPGVATIVTASWTFASQRTGARAALPVSVVRFTPSLDTAGTAPAGKALRVPVAVRGAASQRVRALEVAYSVNGGASWQRATVTGGVATIPAQRAGTGVALRAKLTDTAGNTLTQTALGAYRTR